ncbi:predicted protein [Streptomyces iranensis]|uniref:Uncharacterized protein n=1 Tax=Streptomyces iranensis TaxID=576784 RepID=A0A060ZVX2_9ACTN|nr:predicted protein [Streptomyces iranensis]
MALSINRLMTGIVGMIGQIRF